MKKRKDSGLGESRTALARTDTKATRAKVRKTGPNRIEITSSRSLDDMLSDICTPTGTQHDEVAIRIIDQVAVSLVRPKPADADQSLLQAISTIAGLAPQDMIEAMLATQMIATHEAGLRFLEIANRPDQTIAAGGATLLWATRLMRLHLDQIEAMQRLKGKAGQQKVVVEHVHVYRGGQAIVGTVAAAGPGAVGDDTENR